MAKCITAALSDAGLEIRLHDRPSGGLSSVNLETPQIWNSSPRKELDHAKLFRSTRWRPGHKLHGVRCRNEARPSFVFKVPWPKMAPD